MPQGFASRSAAPATVRRRRTGHSTWARPTGFAVDSSLEGTGFEPSVPGKAPGGGFSLNGPLPAVTLAELQWPLRQVPVPASYQALPQDATISCETEPTQ